MSKVVYVVKTIAFRANPLSHNIVETKTMKWYQLQSSYQVRQKDLMLKAVSHQLNTLSTQVNLISISKKLPVGIMWKPKSLHQMFTILKIASRIKNRLFEL